MDGRVGKKKDARARQPPHPSTRSTQYATVARYYFLYIMRLGEKSERTRLWKYNRYIVEVSYGSSRYIKIR